MGTKKSDEEKAHAAMRECLRRLMRNLVEQHEKAAAELRRAIK